MTTPLLSIGMIVKNEIRCIERCLLALRPLREAIPCELVIADTGSTDGTRAVAERYADLIFEFPWVGDFSAARNAVLDRCHGKWVFVVDADEYLDPEIAQLVDFLTGPDADRYLRAGVDQYNYADADMSGAAVDFLAIRLARMEPGLRFQGAVHEMLPPVRRDQFKPLIDVKLHHDGYAKDPKDPGRMERKAERNLALLDQELARVPGDLQRLSQCVESSLWFPARAAEDARRAMAAVIGKPDCKERRDWGPVIARVALETAASLKMQELETWREFSFSTFPGSIFLRLDGAFVLLKLHWERREYEAVPELARTYLTAWEDYQARNFDWEELLHSSPRHATLQSEALIRASCLEALGRLGRQEEAAALLAEERHWAELGPGDVRKLLIGASWSAGEAAAQAAIAQAAETLRALPEKEHQNWKMFQMVAGQTFQGPGAGDGPDRPWRLFRQVEGTLGLAAQVMGSTGPEEAGALLAQVEDWEAFPAPALVHALQFGTPLPAGLFSLGYGPRQTMIEHMARSDPEFAYHVASRPWATPHTLPELQFQYDLTAGALQLLAPLRTADGGTMCWRLCRKLTELACALFPWLYGSRLLDAPEDWIVLPGMHQFGLWLWAAEQARARGDTASYVRDLRLGLKATPQMKDMVELLLERAEAEANATPELRQLADQVRDILGKFPPDDPAVEALKRSEAYQRVAYLIEGQDAPSFGGLTQ